MAVQNSSKKWMLIGGGVIAAAALVVGFQNYPPQPKDAAGTIGGAQRYHEPQITGDDVKVSQDELTKWIQSDTFDRIVKDPEARKLFADDAVRAEMSGGVALAEADGSAKAMRQVAADGDGPMDQASRNLESLESLDHAAGRSKLDLAPSDLAGADSLRGREMSPLFDKPFDGLLLKIKDNAALSAALEDQAFCKALRNPGLSKDLAEKAREMEPLDSEPK